jgi:hypothetical protein
MPIDLTRPGTLLHYPDGYRLDTRLKMTQPKPPSEKVSAKTKSVLIKFTPEQHRLIVARSQRCGVRVTVWMRHILMQAATRQAVEGHLRIREPNGVTI